MYLDHKSNEIQGIKLLLEQLDLSDTLVSIDAIGTQTEIAEGIIQKGGDYILHLPSYLRITYVETFIIRRGKVTTSLVVILSGQGLRDKCLVALVLF